MMIQITSAIMDEELGGSPFVVLRSFFRKSEGEKTLLRQEQYETIGTIHPAKMEEILLLPEEYHHEPVLLIHSPVSLSLGGPVNEKDFTAPDQVIYQHQTWLVVSVRDWSSFGFCKALAVLQKEGTAHATG